LRPANKEVGTMRDRSGFGRLMSTAFLAIIAVAATDSRAGPSQATKDRCTAYAKRAVEQYRLMKSHPECEVKNDPLTWQDSYDNHYNGCVLLPEAMGKMAEAGRDNHLQACGAFSDSANTAAPQPTANATSNQTPAASAQAPASIQAPAASAPQRVAPA